MCGPYVHSIDPIVLDVAGLHVWWYGLGYSLGFFEVLWFLLRVRRRIGLTHAEVYALSLLFAVAVLAGGRTIEVAFDEWPFYRDHLTLIPALWLGGMATHGLLLGAAFAVWIFARTSGKPLLTIADHIVIPGAVLMGMGRIGNFIDGQIVGSATDVCWGVRFPDAEGFRHPVVLYDAAKNFVLAVFLLRLRARQPPPGRLAALFVFWYAFSRIFIDLFRDYPTHRLPWGTGQTLNALMAATGVLLLLRSHRLNRRADVIDAPAIDRRAGLPMRLAFGAILLFCLLIPSNWTQNVPARYASRHPGLKHSVVYPAIETRPGEMLSVRRP